MRAYLRAAARSLPAPEPWAVAERRAKTRLVGSVLVRPFWPEHRAADQALAQEGELVGPLAQALGSWHARGFRHGDCYPKNVLLGPDGSPEVTIVAGRVAHDPAGRRRVR